LHPVLVSNPKLHSTECFYTALISFSAARSICASEQEEIMQLIAFTITGLNAPEFGVTLMRISIGVFFIISGYHKLFNPQRHATVRATMVADHVPEPILNSWLVPSVEFSGGAALLIGFLTPLAALGLFVVCCGATLADGLKRIKAYQPLDRADYLDDVLYLPEVLYAIILLTLIFVGAGPFSVDAMITHTEWWGL
jgi:uncharacterized membrane protein YphA (DoxX/SURF4 family)